MEERVQLKNYPNYSMDLDGVVYNETRNTRITPGRTGRGNAKINLYTDGYCHTLSYGLLVAQTLVWNDFDPKIFDTPIHLDHDPLNNHPSNLMWRPRWFAVRYYKQYWFENYHSYKAPVIEEKTGERFDAIRWACEKHGLLWYDVFRSCEFGEAVFPYRQKFEYGNKL